MKKIKSVDKVRKEQRRQTVESDPASFGTLLLGGNNGGSVLEKAAKRSDIVQYILVLANDLINGIAAAISSQASIVSAADYCQMLRHSLLH